MNIKSVSIVIPTVGGSLRRQYALDEALESLFAQTIPFKEIVVFDNSISQTIRVNSKYAEDKRVHWVMAGKHFSNPLVSWNTAVKSAHNPYVTILGDDDYAMPYAHEEIQKCLQIANLGYLPVVSVDTNKIVYNNVKKPAKTLLSSDEFRYNVMLSKFYTSLMGVVFSKEDFEMVGGFEDALLPKYGLVDLFLWYKLSAKQSVVACSRKNCFCYLSSQYVTDWVGKISSLDEWNLLSYYNLIEDRLSELGVPRNLIFPPHKDKQKLIDYGYTQYYCLSIVKNIKQSKWNFLDLTQKFFKTPITSKEKCFLPFRLIIYFFKGCYINVRRQYRICTKKRIIKLL